MVSSSRGLAHWKRGRDTCDPLHPHFPLLLCPSKAQDTGLISVFYQRIPPPQEPAHAVPKKQINLLHSNFTRSALPRCYRLSSFIAQPQPADKNPKDGVSSSGHLWGCLQCGPAVSRALFHLLLQPLDFSRSFRKHQAAAPSSTIWVWCIPHSWVPAFPPAASWGVARLSPCTCSAWRCTCHYRSHLCLHLRLSQDSTCLESGF